MRHHNAVIGSDTGFTVYRAAFYKFVNGVIFKAGYEENSFFGQKAKPDVANITLVKSNDGAFWQVQAFSHTAFMGAGIAYVSKCGDISVMVENSINFYAAFIMPIRSPGKK